MVSFLSCARILSRMADLWRTCRRCLSYEGMHRLLGRTPIPIALRAGFRVDDDGVCTVCKAYDAAARDLAAERDAAIAAARSGAVVAMSGGKDAISTLYTAKRKLGLDVTAVMLDHGFLVDAALRQARRVCKTLDVPLVVARPGARALRRFDRAVHTSDLLDAHPCQDCGVLVHEALLAAADDCGAGAVLVGGNYFISWSQGVVRGTAPETTPKGHAVLFAHLPYLLGLTRAAVLRNVRAAGAVVVAVKGISSNCRVPAIVDDRLGASLGHIPELEELSLEVMVGHRSRRSALDELRRKSASGRHNVRRFYSTPRSG
jgi:hypothetical protein